MNILAQDRFNSFLTTSLLIHLGVLILTRLTFSFWSPSEDILIKKAIRVDLVALPEKQLSRPTPKVKTKKVEKVNLKPPKNKKSNKVNLKKNKNAQKKALDKLKAMSAIEKIKQQMKNDEIKKAQIESKKAPPKAEEKYKGNVITSGSSLEGLDKLSMNRYYSSIEGHIQNYWFLPQWLDELNLNAQALVYIDERGQVIGREIYQSSDNPVFDKTVLTTIDKASPFPLPPSRLQGLLKNSGFVLKFPN